MANFGAWLRALFGSPPDPKQAPEHRAKEPIKSGSDESVKSTPPSPDVQTRSSHRQSFAEGNNDFALAMYRQFQQPGNLFFSPFSIRAALGMTYAGARGETATQINEVCRFSSSDDNLHISFVIRRLNTSRYSQCEMEVANSLWGQDGVEIKAEFLDLIAKYYEGGLNLVDFRHGAEAARLTINQWVDDKTRHKIQEILSGNLDPDTRLILVNAIYLKGMWSQPFSEEFTRDKPFYLESGTKVQAPLMYQEGYFRYMNGEGYQAVDMGYRGSDLSMVILLPDRKDGLRELEKKVTAQMLHDCVARMETREVKLFLPKFKITWGTVNLINQLIALGMPLAFDRSQADFSGINGYQPPDEEAFFISDVFHKAFVEVNEEGTEAAAATVVEMPVGAAMGFSLPPRIPIFRADHPFLFAIRDRVSGAILFLGRITDPTQ